MENNIHRFDIPDESEQTFFQRARDTYDGVIGRINARLSLAYGSLADKMQPADEQAALRQQRWQTARAWSMGAFAVGMIFQRVHGINLLEGLEEHVQAAQDVSTGSGMTMNSHGGVVEIPYHTTAMTEQIDDPGTVAPETPANTDTGSSFNRQAIVDWFKRLVYTGDTSHAAVDIGTGTVDDPPAVAPDIYNTKPAPLINNAPVVQVPPLQVPELTPPATTYVPPPEAEVPIPSFPGTVAPHATVPSVPTPNIHPEITTPAAPPATPPEAVVTPSPTAPATTPPPPETVAPAAPQPSAPVETAPAVNRFGTLPSNDEYLWTYLHEHGQTNVMADLDEASAELQKKTGAKVSWFGWGTHRWLRINGRTDTPYLWRLLAPFYKNK